MDSLRREELAALWSQEMDNPESLEWREELTPEERDFVAGLDGGYNRGVRRVCENILIREKLRQRFRPDMVEELTALKDCCRLRLRDGQVYLVRLTDDSDLAFQAVDTAC